MKLVGTEFQLKVWAYLRKIPRGSVKTYSQVAKAIGKPLAVRAVANAIGKNPYAPKIPCHRVIRSDGSLGGYSGKGGIKTKRFLLKKEGYKALELLFGGRSGSVAPYFIVFFIHTPVSCTQNLLNAKKTPSMDV